MAGAASSSGQTHRLAGVDPPRPTGLQDPPSSHCAYTNFLTQLETIETEAKRDETDRLVILSVDTLLSVKGLESFSQAVEKELDRHVLPSPKMIWP